jgi:voltage-gated sodium channel
MQETLTPQDGGTGLRARAARFMLAPLTQRVLIGLIVLNGIVLGLETSASLMAEWGGVLLAIDRALLYVFTAELTVRIYAFRSRFFRDPWGIFDLIVVGIAWLPASGALSVLRALRILRVLRLISVVPSMRTVVEAMLAALPGMGSIVALMLLLFYVFAVMATKLYGEILPDKFGTLGMSLLSLFQLMTLEGWIGDIVLPAMEQAPWSWLFFIPFILIATFVVLNLFIGVIVESIQNLRAAREETRHAAQMVEDSAARAAAQADAAAMLREMRALRAELAELRQLLPPAAAG